MNADDIVLTVWSWNRGNTAGSKSTTTSKALLSNPFSPTVGQLRIISSPLDLSTPQSQAAFVNYTAYYGLPTEFLLERQQGVNHSFGAMPSDTSSDTKISWFHLICKEVLIDASENGSRAAMLLVPEVPGGVLKDPARWFHFSFALIQTQSQDSGITLLCFDLAPQLQHRFDALLKSNSWSDVLVDPYLLFCTLLESIWITMDTIAWRLADVFRNVEMDTLIDANKSDTVVKTADFANLHNISKHAIYLAEAFEAAQILVASISNEYQLSTQAGNTLSSPRGSRTYAQLQRHARLFRSTQLRVASLERRISNITNMSFNVVTQQDSRIMQRDSASMHTIAIMTLVFLPGSLIATLFGSAFFNFDVESDGSHTASLSSYFWIFWVVAIPCTIIVFVLWLKFNPARVRGSQSRLMKT